MPTEPAQLTRAWLAQASPAEIKAAYNAGKLASVAAGGDGDVDHDGSRPEQWTRADLAGKSPQEIIAAKRAGHLNDLAAGRSIEAGDE